MQTGYGLLIKVTHASSPQIKGIIERLYRWPQDRVMRTCMRDNVIDIRQAQRVLDHEIQIYNDKQVYSTTQEVPYFRFQRALKEKWSLFREFTIRPPVQSVKDIFCLQINKTIDPYRRISINNLQVKVNNTTPKKAVTLRSYPLSNDISGVRFWCDNTLIDIQRVKNSDRRVVQFYSVNSPLL